MLGNWSQFELNADENHIDLFELNLQRYIHRGSSLALSYLYTLLARMQIKAGKYEEADITIEKAMNNLTRGSEHFFQAEIYRLKGEISAKGDANSFADSQTFLDEAVLCARQQSAAGLELRAANSLATHLVSQGKREKARTLLTSTIEKLTEGSSLQEYQTAMGMLNQLKSANKESKVAEPA